MTNRISVAVAMTHVLPLAFAPLTLLADILRCHVAQIEENDELGKNAAGPWKTEISKVRSQIVALRDKAIEMMELDTDKLIEAVSSGYLAVVMTTPMSESEKKEGLERKKSQVKEFSAEVVKRKAAVYQNFGGLIDELDQLIARCETLMSK